MEISTFLMLGLVYFMLYCSIFWLVIYYDKRKGLSSDPKSNKTPLVSIIIPVYKNDTASAIKKSVISALAIDYPKKEILIVWNGPRAETIEICKDFANKKLVKFFETSKIGKAAGMNEGLKHVKGELFCCLDADSFFHRDALNHMTGYFEDKIIGAVASSIKVYKPKTFMQRIQWVEYIFSVYLRKMASLVDCLYVIPGPGSMYRTSIIKELGGFDEHNLTEDMEMAFRIQSAGYKIKNSLNAFVDTIAPDNLKALIRQRVRWYTGFCDNLKKYKGLLLNPKAGMLGMFMLPLAMVWVGVIIYILFYLIITTMSMVISNSKALMLVGFDWQMFVVLLKEAVYTGLQPTFLTWYSLVFVVLGLTVIYLGLKMSNETVDIYHKYPSYVGYFLLYSILVGVFWMFALSYLFVRKKGSVMW